MSSGLASFENQTNLICDSILGSPFPSKAPGILGYMFQRSDTCRTMASRTMSTGDLGRGLSHILLDADAKLPDDLDEVKEHRDLNHMFVTFNMLNQKG